MSVYPAGAVVERTADLSSDGRYRYALMRRWSRDLPVLTFVMLNPSTADATKDDPTIRRCVAFAVRDGYGGVEVVNLYAFRATKPADLFAAADPVGHANDWTLEHVFKEAHRTGSPVVAGWGSNARRDPDRVRDALDLPCARLVLHHLGLTKTGEPRHPLYLPADAQLTRYAGADV